jgi:hypothetical protein
MHQVPVLKEKKYFPRSHRLHAVKLFPDLPEILQHLYPLLFWLPPQCQFW